MLRSQAHIHYLFVQGFHLALQLSVEVQDEGVT
jgi:hypothetical protein